MDRKKLYDIVLIDIPVRKYSVDDELSKKLNQMYSMNDYIFKLKTGYQFDEKKYYYSSGLLCLSTYLKKKNFTVGYVNYPKDESKLKDMILEAEYVGFTTVTVTMEIIFRLIEKIKEWNHEIKVILGGYHASFCAEELLIQHESIDSVIIGEGEVAMGQVLENVPRDRIKGICYRDEKGTVHINKENVFLDEDEIPIPDFSLIEDELNDYNIYIGTMRGCIGKCNFCVNHSYWGKPRFIPLEKVEKSLAFLYERINESRLIHFIDNVFTINKERIKKISELVQPYKMKFAFECDTLASLLDKERVMILDYMNVVKVGLGFEDCQDEINKLANKSVTISDNIKGANIIRKYAPRICVYAYWMIGLPGTSTESVEKNMETIKMLITEEVVHIISPKIFIPYPGTVFYERSMEFGLYITSNNYNNYERISPPYPYRLTNIDEFQLENMLHKIIDVCIESYSLKWNWDCEKAIPKYNTWYENE